MPEPIQSLPLILVGPILRRAEESQVCIWIACSKPVTIKASIFALESTKKLENEKDKKTATVVGSGTAKSIRLGDRLHVALVIAKPYKMGDENGTVLFPTGQLLAYDIEVMDQDTGASHNLKDLGLLSGPTSIAYDTPSDSNADSCMPTFFLTGENFPLNFLHGSCRKLHGKGEDCLAAADDLIRSSFDDLKKRPSMLILTGDQIYADDVAAPLSQYLVQLARTIVGWDEEIKGTGLTPSEIKLANRQKLVQDHAHFTSGEAENHLLTFGEFAAMYLVTWNEKLWPPKFPDVSSVPKAHRRKYAEHLKQLEKARRELPFVRRVLANVPTYMIFDDHDITDDWNITKEWYESVRKSNCGKQIIANGLAAYWAFQGWGNDASSFNSDFVDAIVEFLSKNNGTMDDAEQKTAFEEKLWSFEGWSFRIPVNPFTIVMDCRTHRYYDSLRGPAQLLSKPGYSFIARAAKEFNYSKGEAVIIVLPTPVFGFLLLEALQRIGAKLTSIYKLDLETWFANERGLVNFLGFLMKELEPMHCTFLSGDVHYGFTISAATAILQKELDEYMHMSIVQLTSSALKTTSLVKIAFISEIMGRIRQLFPWKQVLRFGWATDGTSEYRLSSKALRYKAKPTPYFEVRPRKETKELATVRPPDWIEARRIVRPTGSITSPILVSDNNIGLVTISKDTITHTFVTHTEKARHVKLYKTSVGTDGGRNDLDGLIISKMGEFAKKRLRSFNDTQAG